MKFTAIAAPLAFAAFAAAAPVGTSKLNPTKHIEHYTLNTAHSFSFDRIGVHPTFL